MDIRNDASNLIFFAYWAKGRRRLRASRQQRPSTVRQAKMTNCRVSVNYILTPLPARISRKSKSKKCFLATAAIADIHIIQYKFSAMASMEL